MSAGRYIQYLRMSTSFLQAEKRSSLPSPCELVHSARLFSYWSVLSRREWCAQKRPTAMLCSSRRESTGCIFTRYAEQIGPVLILYDWTVQLRASTELLFLEVSSVDAYMYFRHHEDQCRDELGGINGPPDTDQHSHYGRSFYHYHVDD